MPKIMNGYINIRPGGGDTGAPLNMQKRLDLIQRYADLAGRRVIDLGCGTGQYLLALLQFGADAYGVEYAYEKARIFCSRNPGYADRILVNDIQKVSFSSCSFDIALLNEVLEHVPNDLLALQEVRRILKPGGLLIVFSPNRVYPFETHGAHFKHSRRYIPHYVPFVPYLPVRLGNHFLDYSARNYWPTQLRAMVKQVGMNIVDVGFIWQTFENISGNQPKVIARFMPLLRRMSVLSERIPLLSRFGVSQVVIAQK